jgi:phage gp45-like
MAWDFTARATAVRAVNSGGARGTVASMDTSKLMQAMTGTMFAGEARQALEHFEPYGFTSAIISKNADGVAEAVMHYITGARGHAAAGVIGDRRYRPMGLGQGENSQHDDIGQMSLLRRTGAYLLSLDGQGGASSDTPGSDNNNRMVSIRHVVKSKQPRTPMSGGGQVTDGSQLSQTSDQAGQFKHEGEEVNTEIRATAKKIQLYDQTTLVAEYDRDAKTWKFIAEKDINLKAGQNIIMNAGKNIIGIAQADVGFKATGNLEIVAGGLTGVDAGGNVCVQGHGSVSGTTVSPPSPPPPIDPFSVPG